MKQLSALILILGLAFNLNAKPLKVYILAGQSNMEGVATTATLPAIAKDPETAPLYAKIVGTDGEPRVYEDIWISYSYGDQRGNPKGVRRGQLTTGFGRHEDKIGPELMFGITMHELQEEPILLIKTAWGGKSLMVDFRPPSAGELEDPKQEENAGVFYRAMIEHVRKELADPKQILPDYDPKEGYELAGFVWFQGFNDMVGPYPSMPNNPGGRRAKDFSEYSRLLACLIRDVRKDLNAPKLPFVIGAIGVGGDSHAGSVSLREAMAVPATMDEFEGTVRTVFTHPFWPAELGELRKAERQVQREMSEEEDRLFSLENEDRDRLRNEFYERRTKAVIEKLGKEGYWLLRNGVSNQGFHYFGSAKFFAQIGEAFAKAMLEIQE